MAVIDNKQEAPTKILGMSKLTFYSVSGIIIFLVGFGLYKVFKK